MNNFLKVYIHPFNKKAASRFEKQLKIKKWRQVIAWRHFWREIKLIYPIIAVTKCNQTLAN